ncbi:MAG: hypothetical protein FWD41_02700 [Actinomycetia bacterium]|nr:hypothetical protein [Actinomycetes bacterium]
MPIETEKIDEVVQNATQTVQDVAQKVGQGFQDAVQNVTETTEDAVSVPDISDQGELTQRDKGMAMLAYVLFFVPLLTGDATRSSFVKYHTNQGTILFIAGAIYSIIFSIIQSVLGLMVAASFFSSPFLGLLLTGLLSLLSILGLIPIGFAILGIINAANGVEKPLPIIGDFTVIK